MNIVDSCFSAPAHKIACRSDSGDLTFGEFHTMVFSRGTSHTSSELVQAAMGVTGLLACTVITE